MLTSAPRSDCLSAASVAEATRSRSPGVSSVTFRAQPPNLRFVNERGNGEDYSLIWRPRVDSGRFGDLMDTKDAAVQVVQGGEKGYEIVLWVFGKYGWPIFRRLCTEGD